MGHARLLTCFDNKTTTKVLEMSENEGLYFYFNTFSELNCSSSYERCLKSRFGGLNTEQKSNTKIKMVCGLKPPLYKNTSAYKLKRGIVFRVSNRSKREEKHFQTKHTRDQYI